jgi:hypothetical protein
LDDPYPSYGKKYLALLEANDAYTVAVNDTHRSMAAIRDTSSNMISDVIKHQDVYAQHLELLKDKITRLTNSYLQHSELLRRCFHVLIEEYREANRNRRSTPSPPYFGMIVPLEVRSVPSYQLPSPPHDVSTFAAEATAALTRAHDEEIAKLVPVASLGTENVA